MASCPLFNDDLPSFFQEPWKLIWSYKRENTNIPVRLWYAEKISLLKKINASTVHCDRICSGIPA